MKYAALLLAFSGCVTAGPGLPMTKTPPDVPFCEAGWAATDNGGGANTVALVNMHSCDARLYEYQSLPFDEAWSGIIDFGLMSDDQGVVQNVCVISGNFGNVPSFVGCLAEKLRGLRVAPNQRFQHRVQFVNK